MTLDRRLGDLLGAEGRLAKVEEELGRLKGGDGNGTSGGMEARIAKLEAQMDAVRSDLGKLGMLPVDVARLDERVKHLPGKGFIVTTSATSLALIAALVAFADKLRAFVG